jgi:hypothetical protein
VQAAFDLTPDVEAYLPLTTGATYVVLKEVSAGERIGARARLPPRSLLALTRFFYADWYDGATADYRRSGLFPVAYTDQTTRQPIDTAAAGEILLPVVVVVVVVVVC